MEGVKDVQESGDVQRVQGVQDAQDVEYVGDK